MLLRTVKQISPETVVRINRNQANLAFLFNLRDAAFLREDILAKNLQASKKGYYREILMHENIGPLVMPEYGLVRSSIGNISYFQGLPSGKPEELNFTITLIRNNSFSTKVEVAVFVDTPAHSWKEFSFNPFSCGDAEGRGNLLTVAAYFYNKRVLYEKTQAFLLAKQIALATALGEAYTSDLIALFSAPPSEATIENFDISEKNLRKEILPYGRNDPKDLFRQKCKAIDFGELPFYVNEALEAIGIYLYLGPDNTLVLDACYVGTASSVDKRAVSVTDVKFTKFADEQLNAWLKNLEQLTAFGLDIWEVLKTKILVGTI
jgi:hypothetical protein